jgi:predicted MarR family transcription regulator
MELPWIISNEATLPNAISRLSRALSKVQVRLRRTENELMAALGVSSVAELEGLLLHEAHKRDSPFSAQIAAYYEQHEDLGAADKVFEAATELQRQRIAAADAAAVEMAQIFSNIDC